MTVASFKKYLKDRNISVSGRKADLVSRLKAAIASGVPLQQNMTNEQRENMGGEGFAPVAHWELMSPEEEEINQEGLARAPTVPVDETQGLGAKKRNYSHWFNRPVFQQEVLLPK